MSLTACITKLPNEAGNISNTDQSNVTYTKEFSYLPTYSNMKFKSITLPPDKDQLVTARYFIVNTTTDKVLIEYADILKKDGWTINWTYKKDKMPSSA